MQQSYEQQGAMIPERLEYGIPARSAQLTAQTPPPSYYEAGDTADSRQQN